MTLKFSPTEVSDIDFQTTEFTSITSVSKGSTGEDEEVTGQNPDYVKIGIYYSIGVVGVIGNVVVIIVLSSSAKIRGKIVNIFLINQSILDCVSAVFLIASAWNDYQQENHFGLSGELYCRLWSMKVPMWSAFMSSTYNLVALTLERYMEVNHPIKHRISFTKNHAISVIIFVWLTGPVYNFPLTGLTSTSRDGKCYLMTEWPSVPVQMFCGVLTFFLEFFLPLAVMITAYARMAKALNTRVSPSDSNNPAPVSKTDSLKQRARTNIIRTLVLVAVCFFICLVWNQVFFLLFNLGYPSRFDYFYDFTIYAAFLNCCINPFVYTAQYKDFQNQAKKLLGISKGNTTESSINTIQD